ncbi:MAG TPA: type II toxin-antitoxin system death-on-curing family toxin [Herpetosiphonaceae bacterium]|nr:type II toxin-antitoxin system death-on-curing family toxin [Herpetosiphonaceae bacterium]
MTHFLGLTDVLMIQAMTIRHIGGIHGITEQGFERLATALAAPQQSMFGEDLYPDVTAKAAALFDALVSGHCFSDGNKRTALLSMIEFLARNGLRFAAPDDDALYDWVLEAAARANTRQDQAAWIAERCEAGDV